MNVRTMSRIAGLAACTALVLAQAAHAQPAPGNGPPANGAPRGPMTIAPDPRVQQKTQFNVDANRIYMLGHSMGGAGTIFLGQKHADYFAAIAAIAPAAFMIQRDQEEILAPIKAAHLPIMITQGDQDPVVPVANTRTWAEAMDELGMEQEYIEMAGRDHGNIIWDGMPAILRFFAAHTRTPKVWTPPPRPSS
jgi:alpha-beta hydrolase superfamily lysophospholipase